MNHYCSCQRSLFIVSYVWFVIYSVIVVEYHAAEEQFGSRKNVNLYYSFKSLIHSIYTEKYMEQYSTHVLFYRYERECIKSKVPEAENKTRKPFIEVESNNDIVRNILIQMLASRANATVLEDPAECLEEFENYYHARHPLYSAYSTLSMYANAHQATVKWYDSPVVVTGYWAQKAALFINKAFENQKLPVYNSPVYDYPSDLLLPDIAFSVHYGNLPNVSETYVRRTQEIITKINGPVMFQLKPTLTHDEMVKAMIRETIKGLTKELDTSDFVDAWDV